MTPQKFILVHDTVRSRALEAVRNAPDGVVVQINSHKKTVSRYNCAKANRVNDWPSLPKPLHRSATA